MDIQAGDWVCFQQLGMPCYGRVDYVRENKFLPEHEVITTAGTCRIVDILEVRREARHD